MGVLINKGWLISDCCHGDIAPFILLDIHIDYRLRQQRLEWHLGITKGHTKKKTGSIIATCTMCYFCDCLIGFVLKKDATDFFLSSFFPRKLLPVNRKICEWVLRIFVFQHKIKAIHSKRHL